MTGTDASRRRRKQLSLDEYVAGVLAADRAVLGRAITLVESNAAADHDLAQAVLVKLLPHTGKAYRIGITGVPGVGKSTFIESFGTMLTSRGHRVAVLAVDPSSTVTGGSILGDKTRMNRLSRDERAFVRPSPSSGSLGGVARKTRESMLVCEAAGFDVVLVETVGVGQSETTVAQMVDIFIVLMLANAGDELQGIKRGVLELADMVAINKSDGDNLKAARFAKREYSSALRLMRPQHPAWRPPVLMISGLKEEGLDELWKQTSEYRTCMEEHGAWETKRHRQLRGWMWQMVEEETLRALHSHPRVSELAKQLEREVMDGTTTATLAAQALLEAFGSTHG